MGSVRDGWFLNEGCPPRMLDSDTRVEVQLRSGLKATGPISDFKWETVDGVSDIMMWRTNLLPETVRQFETGATRSPDVGRYDPEGFFSPLVFERFCEYMNAHRKQTDGSIRDSDNWQKGLPLSTYMKGGWRHFLHWWKRHRGFRVNDAMAGQNMEEDLCALLFNVQGYLHELLKQRESLVIKSTQTASES